MEPPIQIILPYIEQSANIIHNEASQLLVNCTLLRLVNLRFDPKKLQQSDFERIKFYWVY